MKILLFTAAIAAALGTAASACPIDIDGNATVTTRDAKIRGNTGVGVKMILLPPQSGIPKRDVRTSATASMTVRWNTAPPSAFVAKATYMRLTPALRPLDAVI